MFPMYDESPVHPHHAPQASGSQPVAVNPNRPRNIALLVGAACVVALFALVAGALVVAHVRSNAVVLAEASATGKPTTTIGGQPTTSVADPALAGASDTTVAAGSSDAAVIAGASTPDAAPAGGAKTAPAANNAGSPGNAGGSQGAPAPKAPPAPTGPAPTITSFKTPENIDCHNGNQQNFSASWTTTNAVKTSIAIDGAPYQSYGPNADVSLPFNCAKAHTFTLTATSASGKTVTKSITLQPRNVQKPPTNDDDNNTPITVAPTKAK